MAEGRLKLSLLRLRAAGCRGRHCDCVSVRSLAIDVLNGIKHVELHYSQRGREVWEVGWRVSAWRPLWFCVTGSCFAARHVVSADVTRAESFYPAQPSKPVYWKLITRVAVVSNGRDVDGESFILYITFLTSESLGHYIFLDIKGPFHIPRRLTLRHTKCFFLFLWLSDCSLFLWTHNGFVGNNKNNLNKVSIFILKIAAFNK